MKLSLVVPSYNEEGNLDLFFSESCRVFSDMIDDLEFVFVNDGSSDKTGEVLKNIVTNNPNRHIVALSFSRNFGKEAAIAAGMKYSSGDYICLIDADMQQRPEVALEMLEYIEAHGECDCVTAYQKKRKEGKVISAENVGVEKTPNIISAMSGQTGTKFQINAGYMDYAYLLNVGNRNYIIYIRKCQDARKR